MVFVWEYVLSPLGGVWAIYELLPAFLVSLAVVIVVSLCTKAPSQEVYDIYNRALDESIDD